MTADLPIEARAELNELYRFCVFSENGKVFFGIPERKMRAILEDRLKCGRLISHRNAEGKIDGVLMWHRIKSGKDMKRWNWEPDKEDGDEIFISAAISDTDKARRVGVLRMIAKEPDVLHLKISALRHKGGRSTPQRVEYGQKMLTKMLK